MTLRKALTGAIAAGTLLCTGTLMAQDMSSTGMQNGKNAVYETATGQVTIKSVNAAAPQAGPVPSFDQLSSGSKSITAEQAAAYPPLANDFLHADSNRNGRISKSEYDRWSKKLQAL